MAENRNAEEAMLLLELGIETDESSFESARSELDKLKDSLSNFDLSFDFGNVLSGLKNALEALKLIVATWNSLEEKALNVTFNTNTYLPYNIDAGTRANIAYQTATSRVAQNFGVNENTILGDIEAITAAQYNLKRFGNDPNYKPFVAIETLGKDLGDSGFSARLADMLTQDVPPLEVYQLFSSLISDAYRKMYSLPKNSKERQKLLESIKAVTSSSYFSDSMANLIAFYTNPSNPDYGKSGDPTYRFYGTTPIDDSGYMQEVEDRGAKLTSVVSDIDYNKGEKNQAKDILAQKWVLFWDKRLGLPISSALRSFWSDLAGMPDHLLPFGVKDYKGSRNTRNYLNSDEDLSFLYEHFGVSSNWVERADLLSDVRKELTNKMSTLSDDPSLQEIGWYDILMTAGSSYGTNAKTVVSFMLDKLANDPKFDGAKKLNKDARLSAYNSMLNELKDPNSLYYLSPDSGFSGVFDMLHRTGNLSDEDFLSIMNEVYQTVDMNELRRLKLGDAPIPEKDVLGGQFESYNDGPIHIRLTIEDAKTGDTYTDTVMTASELSNGIRVELKDPMR